MKKTSKAAITEQWFGNWANEYDQTLGKMKRHHALLDLAVRASRVKAGERVLDLGCGTGLLSLKLLKAADCRVVGADSSPAMLDIFKQKIDKLGLAGRASLRNADARSLPFRGQLRRRRFHGYVQSRGRQGCRAQETARSTQARR